MVNVESSTDDPAIVAANLKAAGTEVEETAEEIQPKEPADAGAKEKKSETGAESEPAKTKEAQAKETHEEEPPEGSPKEPKWYRQEIKKANKVNRELSDRLSKIERKQAETPSVAAAAAPVKETTIVEPQSYSGKPEPAEPKFEDFKDADDPYAEFGKATIAFTKAHHKWGVEEVEAKIKFEREADRAAAEFADTRQAFQASLPEAAKLYDDFDDTLKGATTVMASPVMQHVIYTSDVGPHILYHFAKNPDVAAEIYAMSQEDQLVAMGELRGEIRATVKGTQKKPPEPPKKKTLAPEPPATLKGGEPPGPSSARELAGSEDRIVDMVKFNPDYERKRREERRGRL